MNRGSADNLSSRTEHTPGSRIRAIRHRQGLTQSQLASNAGLNQGYLSSIERGERQPRRTTIRAIALALEGTKNSMPMVSSPSITAAQAFWL